MIGSFFKKQGSLELKGRLLNYSQKFASDCDYIFFANIVLRLLGLKSRISVAMKKVSQGTLNMLVISNRQWKNS